MTDVRQESLASLLGGRGGALDASLPPLAFVAGWLLFGHSIGAGAIAAVVCGVAIGAFRFARGEKPRAGVGVVVGTLLGQKTKWRRDPALLRAYSIASWPWVAQYALRVAVFTPLWLDAQVFWLATLRVALSWPLQIVCILVSGWLLKRALPA